MKTNAARLLDSLGIPYELRTYEVDPEDLTAASVARKIGMPLAQVFKTLLTRVDGEATFAVVSGDRELHLKSVAALAGGRKAELMPLAQVEPLTGYVRGGVTVFAARKPFPVIVDDSLVQFDRISVSAGVRGVQLVLAPGDYLSAIDRATGGTATVGSIARISTSELRP